LHHIEKRNPDTWPSIKKGIDEALEHYKEYGFCFSFGDWNEDINGVSVPMVVGNQIYTFNAGGPAYRLSPEFLREEVAPQLKSLARNVEATLIRF